MRHPLCPKPDTYQINGIVTDNGKLRDECLNETLFTSVSHARAVLAAWRDDYNHVRPHAALGGATPAEAAARSPKKCGPGHAPAHISITAHFGHHSHL